MRVRLLLGLVLSLVLATACGAPAPGAAPGTSPAPPKTPDKLTLLYWEPTLAVTSAPFYAVPMAMGYFADENLKVSIEASQGSGQSLQLLAAGKGDIGISNPDELMMARSKGSAVRAVFEQSRTYGTALVVPQAAGIQDSTQLAAYLKGGNLGVASLGSGRIPYAKAFLQSLNLTADKDVSLVAIGVGGQAAATLKGSQAKGAVLWNSAYAEIEGAGVALKRFNAPFETGMFGGVMVVREAELAQKKDVYTRYFRALAKGFAFTMANPDAAVQIYWEYFPESKPKTADAAAIAKARKALESIFIEWDPKGEPWGSMAQPNWEKMQDFALQSGILSKKSDVSSYFSNDLIAGVNQFDAAKVAQEAKAVDLAKIRKP